MKVLNALGESLYETFRAEAKWYGCSCHTSPPCSYCTHEGNPANLEHQDDVWEEVWDLDEAVEQAKASVLKTIDVCTAKHLSEMAAQIVAERNQ